MKQFKRALGKPKFVFQIPKWELTRLKVFQNHSNIDFHKVSSE